MVVFELPPAAGHGSVRCLVLGSCRLTNPIISLRDRGDLEIRRWGLAAHHTAPEALQSLKIVTGELRVPDFLSPYVFDTPITPPTHRLCDWLRAGIDVFILEVFTDQQFCFEDILLQQNFLARGLVQAHRGALLDWFREVCRRSEASEECVQSALDNLRRGGFEPTLAVEQLLRGIRLRTQDGEEIGGALGEMMSRFRGRWLVIGAFEAAGNDAVMQDRRVLNAKVAAAAASCGAAFHDPTDLIAKYGSGAALDGGGADIYEYAPSFYPTVGESLIGLVRQVQPPGRRRIRRPPPPGPPPGVTPSLYGSLKKGVARRLRRLRGG